MDDGHVTLPDSARPRQRTAERIGELDPASPIEVTLTLSGPQLPSLDTGKPAISRPDLEDLYGASPETIATVTREMERLGLTVEEVSRAGRSVRVSGTAAQMEAAFRAGMGMYRSAEQGEFRGREKDVQIPAALEGLVTGVFGLDERRVAHRAKGTPPPAQPAPPPAALTPSDLEGHYDFPAGNGEGQKVGIAEFGGTYFPDDLSAFCQHHELAEATVHIVHAGMKPPTPSKVEQMPAPQREEVLGEAVEVMMDIEIIAGLCPRAELVVYFATFDQKGWIDLLNKLIAGQPDAPSVLSVSWGLAEDSEDWTQAALKEIDLRLQAAAHVGITVCAASGDDGSGDQIEDGHAHVNFPASSPFVLSVGGTMLEDGNDVTWRQVPGQRKGGGGATGGGVSVIFPRPAWQTVSVTSLNGGAIDGRVVPDIAGLAGEPYYDLVFMGESQANGGTSASTPLWAALIARIMASGQPTQSPTFFPPLLYEVIDGGRTRGEATCTDVTVGNNASEPQPGDGYTANAGYDAVSGWGVPNGQRLAASLP